MLVSRSHESASPRERSHRRRAATAVLTAVTLVVLLTSATLAVDLGFMRAVCGDMQHTADSAALAGASALRETDTADSDTVRSRAWEMIERMQKTLGFSAMEDQIIQLGKWDYATREFSELSGGERGPFAIRVVSVRNKTPYFFAGIIGKYSTNVTREAVAVGSGKCGGIWGLRGIRVLGDVVTDSYNSDEGDYRADTAYENGDLCSGRDIVLNGGVEVHGDAMCGFGYEVELNGAAAEITGLTTANSSDISYGPLDFGDIRTNNDNKTIPARTSGGVNPWRVGGGLNFYVNSNDNITLSPGRYYFDSITMRSGATITLTGDTEIYVGGNVAAAGGGIVSKSADPQNLDLVVAGTQFSIGGAYEFYGSLVAPNADVRLLGTADYYGAIIGGTVTMGGDFQVHVDESLPEADFFDPPMPSLVK